MKDLRQELIDFQNWATRQPFLSMNNIDITVDRYLKSINYKPNEYKVLPCVSNIPDYTLVWNIVDGLCTSKKISNDSKIDIFKALTKLESEGKCTMGDLPGDVY